MKIILVFVAVLSYGATCVGQVKRTSPSADEQELRKLVGTWHEAEIKRDVATIGKLLASEFSFLGGSTKKEYLEKVIPDESFNYSATIEEIEVELYGGTGIVTTLETFSGNSREKSAEGKLRIMTIWLKRSIGWQCIKASIQVVTAAVK